MYNMATITVTQMKRTQKHNTVMHTTFNTNRFFFNWKNKGCRVF